jgi:hypothetical protein
LSDQYIIRHCAPTLAGIKTGNLFSVQKEPGEDYIEAIRRLNKILVPKGIRALILKQTEKLVLIYLYRPAMLQADLCKEEARQILLEKGYPAEKTECCIVRLVKQLASGEEFPHEIGLFLGYPPADVKGFMKSPVEGVKCIGCWKVYGNEAEAKRKFDNFQKCTSFYCRKVKEGHTLAQLVI